MRPLEQRMLKDVLEIQSYHAACFCASLQTQHLLFEAETVRVYVYVYVPPHIIWKMPSKLHEQVVAVIVTIKLPGSALISFQSLNGDISDQNLVNKTCLRKRYLKNATITSESRENHMLVILIKRGTKY